MNFLLKKHFIPAYAALFFTAMNAASAADDIAAATPAQTAALKQAAVLLNQGNVQAAYALLLGMEDTLMGDPNFDYLLGTAALDAGAADVASLAFTRVLAVNSQHGGAQIDLGRAYLALGNRDQARAAFEAALENHPPDNVRVRVLGYLKQTLPPAKFSGYMQATLGHDTNINSAGSDSSVFVPLFNITAPLPRENVEMADDYLSLGAGLNYKHAFDPEFYVLGNATASIKKHGSNAGRVFDLSSVSGYGGLGYKFGRSVIETKLNLGHSQRDNDPDRNLAGVAGEWRYTPNDKNQISVVVQHNRLRYLAPDAGVFNTNQDVGGVMWMRGMSDRLTLASVIVLGTESDRTNNPDGRKDFYGLKLAGEYKFAEQIATFLALGVTPVRYSKSNSAFLRMREETVYEAALGASYAMRNSWSVRPRVVYVRQDSNIAIYDFKKTEVSVALRKEF